MVAASSNGPLRIALFLHDLRGGGVERISVNLANGLSRQGHRVDLVLINQAGNRAYFDALDAEVSVLELEQRRTLTSLVGFRCYLNRSRPDLVIAAMTHVNVSALIARSISRAKPHVIVVEHSTMSRKLATQMPMTVRMAYRLAPWIYRWADTIGAVSEGVKQDLAAVAGMPKDTISVLYNPVVGPELIRQAGEPLEHDWFVDDAPPVVLAVGSLTPAKNFALLIAAFALLRARRCLRLMILGEGPLRDDLAERAARTGYGDDIAMPGFVANPFTYMARAAVVALSSDVEGLPTVLIEAMACGTPVVATDCPSGPAEILLGGKLGILTTPGDVEAFAEALTRTLDAPQSPERLMKHAATFDVAQASSRYLDHFRLQGSGSPQARDLAISGL